VELLTVCHSFCAQTMRKHCICGYVRSSIIVAAADMLRAQCVIHACEEMRNW
jgi:hypothetical protein